MTATEMGVRRLNWQAASLLLGFILQAGIVVWYEGGQREQMTALADRIARIEQQRNADSDVLIKMQASVSKISGQLDVLTALILRTGGTSSFYQGHSK